MASGGPTCSPSKRARRNKGQHHRLLHGDVGASTSSGGVGHVTYAMEGERYVPNNDYNMLRGAEEFSEFYGQD